jgi:hypothetical protein
MVFGQSVRNCYQRTPDYYGLIAFILLFSLPVIVAEGVSTRSQPPHAQPSTKNLSETKTPDGADFQSKVETWAAQQHNFSRPTIILRPKYGLGNQLLSLVSGIALALVTDRRLLVAWEEPFRFLLDPPFYLPEGPAKSVGGRATVHFTAHSPGFPAAARALACGDLAGLLVARVVEVEADQFFLPLVLLSPQVQLSPVGMEGLVDGVAKQHGAMAYSLLPHSAANSPCSLTRAVTLALSARARAGFPRPDSAHLCRGGARWRRCSRPLGAGPSGPHCASGAAAPPHRLPHPRVCIRQAASHPHAREARSGPCAPLPAARHVPGVGTREALQGAGWGGRR